MAGQSLLFRCIPAVKILSFRLTIIQVFERLTARAAGCDHHSISVGTSGYVGRRGGPHSCTCAACDSSSTLRPPEPASPALAVRFLARGYSLQYTKTAPATGLCIVDVSRHRSVAALSKAPISPLSTLIWLYVKFPHTLHGLVSLPRIFPLEIEHLLANPNPLITGRSRSAPPTPHAMCGRWPITLPGTRLAQSCLHHGLPTPQQVPSHKDERRASAWVIEHKPSLK